MKKVKLVKVKFLKDQEAHDVDAGGVTLPLKKYGKGQVYMVSEDLAQSLMAEKDVIDFVTDVAPAPVVENKDAGAMSAPAAHEAAPKKKGK